MSQCVYLPHRLCPFFCRWTSGLYTVSLLLTMLLPTLGCVFLFESTQLLLYPQGKYLAVQFWNHRVALFLTSFLFFFYDSHRERGRDTGRGRSRLHAPGARRGIRSRVSRIAPWAKGRRQTTAPPRDPRFIFFNHHPYFHALYLFYMSPTISHTEVVFLIVNQ